MDRREDGTFRARVVDGTGRLIVEVDGYSTVELPLGLDSESLASVQILVRAEEASTEG